MSFDPRYELLEPLTDLTTDCSFQARQRSSGQFVLVHLLGGGKAPENELLIRSIGRLGASDRRHIVDTGVYRGIPYVITDVLPGDPLLRDWLRGLAGAPESAPPPAAPETEEVKPPAPTPSPEPLSGEFTRVLRGWKEPQPEPARIPEERIVSAPATPPLAIPAEEGEFTRLMHAAKPVAANAPIPTADAAPAEPPQPATPRPPTGEFTRIWRAGAPQPEPPPPVRPSREEESLPRPPVPPIQPAQPRQEPGQFTRMFAPPVATPPAAPLSSSPEGTGEFTRMVNGLPAVSRPAPLTGKCLAVRRM